MDSDIVKQRVVFIAIVIAAVAVGFLAGQWWTDRKPAGVPAAGSGTRVMSQQEVQTALQELSAPGNGATRPMTSQEVQQALQSLGAPGK